jgi:hypothetical protein
MKFIWDKRQSVRRGVDRFRNDETEYQAKKAAADIHRAFQNGNSLTEIVVLLPGKPRIDLIAAVLGSLGERPRFFQGAMVTGQPGEGLAADEFAFGGRSLKPLLARIGTNWLPTAGTSLHSGSLNSATFHSDFDHFSCRVIPVTMPGGANKSRTNRKDLLDLVVSALQGGSSVVSLSGRRTERSELNSLKGSP